MQILSLFLASIHLFNHDDESFLYLHVKKNTISSIRFSSLLLLSCGSLFRVDSASLLVKCLENSHIICA